MKLSERRWLAVNRKFILGMALFLSVSSPAAKFSPQRLLPESVYHLGMWCADAVTTPIRRLVPANRDRFLGRPFQEVCERRAMELFSGIPVFVVRARTLYYNRSVISAYCGGHKNPFYGYAEARLGTSIPVRPMRGYGSAFPYPDGEYLRRNADEILGENDRRVLFADVVPLSNLTWDVVRFLHAALSPSGPAANNPEEFYRLAEAGLETWKHAYYVAHQVLSVSSSTLLRLNNDHAYLDMFKGLNGARPISENRRVLNRYNPTFYANHDQYSKIAVLGRMTVGFFGFNGIGPREEFEVFFPVVGAASANNFSENVARTIEQFKASESAARHLIEFLRDLHPLETAWRKLPPFASREELHRQLYALLENIVNKWEARMQSGAEVDQTIADTLGPLDRRYQALSLIP